MHELIHQRLAIQCIGKLLLRYPGGYGHITDSASSLKIRNTMQPIAVAMILERVMVMQRFSTQQAIEYNAMGRCC